MPCTGLVASRRANDAMSIPETHRPKPLRENGFPWHHPTARLHSVGRRRSGRQVVHRLSTTIRATCTSGVRQKLSPLIHRPNSKRRSTRVGHPCRRRPRQYQYLGHGRPALPRRRRATGLPAVSRFTPPPAPTAVRQEPCPVPCIRCGMSHVDSRMCDEPTRPVPAQFGGDG